MLGDKMNIKYMKNSLLIENGDPFNVRIIKLDKNLKENILNLEKIKTLRIFDNKDIKLIDENDFILNHTLNKVYEIITDKKDEIILYNW
jgi:uncharacterized protein YlzI (FlbEa/FlbD family)